MRSAKSAKKNRFTTHHSGATMRFSDEGAMRKVNGSWKLARKLMRSAMTAKARSDRKLWCKLLELEQKRKQARTMRDREAIEEEMRQLPR